MSKFIDEVDIFISYSHKDNSWKNLIVKQLEVYQKHLFSFGIWHDKNINPGKQWLNEIKYAINKARVIVFFISADSLTSDFISDEEIST